MPELRFPEFKDEWSTYKLGEICKFSKGKGISKNDVTDEGTPCIRYGELYTQYDELITETVSRTNLPLDNLVLSQENDIIIPSTGETAIDISQASCIKKDNIAIGGDINILKTQEDGVFLSYYLNYIKTDIAKMAQGISVIHLYSDQLKSLTVNIPSLEEQRKISNLLLLLNKKIDSMEMKLNMIKTYQKETLRKLFDKKTYPPDWKLISLNELGTFYRGLSYNKEEVVENGNIVLRSNNIKENQLDFSLNELQYVSKEIKKEILLQKKDIVICMNNGSKKLVGKSAEYNKNIKKPITVGAFCSIFRPRNKLSKFLFRTETYKRNIYYIIAGSNINNLKNSEMGEFKFYIPTNQDEENNIFTLLTNVDKKINLMEKEILKNKQFKKSLLSKMFC